MLSCPKCGYSPDDTGGFQGICPKCGHKEVKYIQVSQDDYNSKTRLIKQLQQQLAETQRALEIAALILAHWDNDCKDPELWRQFLLNKKKTGDLKSMFDSLKNVKPASLYDLIDQARQELNNDASKPP